MIRSFRHKGSRRFFASGDARGINARHALRIGRILDLQDAAAAPEDLAIPGPGLQPLKGERKGEWALAVSGNWRITFRFEGEDVADVNIEDYH
jgi:proteic killer suppression protein